MQLKGNHKHRFYLFLGLSPFAIILIWNFAFKSTLGRIDEYSALKASSTRYANPPEMIMQLSSKLNEYEKYSMVNLEDADLLLIDMLGRQVRLHSIKLLNIPEIHKYTTGDYTVLTYRLVFSGSFKNLIKFTEYVEKNISWCKVISVSFNRMILRGSAGEELNMEIVMQSINKNNENEK